MTMGNAFAWITAAVCAGISLLFVLGALFLLIASAPNSSERQQFMLKGCAAVIFLACAVSLVLGTWGAVAGKPWIAAAGGAIPGLASAVTLAALWISGS